MRIIKDAIFFTLNIVSTIIFINCLPKNDSQNLLMNYAIASGLISLIVVYTFSVNFLLKNDRKIILFLIAVSALHSIYVNVIYSISLYVCVFILVDYMSTQVFLKFRDYIRIISFLMNGLLIMGGVEVVALARIAVGLILITYYLKSDIRADRLQIKNPNTVIIKSNFVYFGTLFLVTALVTNNLQKTYTAFQFGLSYALKLYDFRLRFTGQNNKNFLFFYGKILGLVPLVYLLTVDTDFTIMILYLASYVSLLRLERVL